ncbi:MAG: hypothetical protein WDW38_004453 [Sanguina aurantia]
MDRLKVQFPAALLPTVRQHLRPNGKVKVEGARTAQHPHASHQWHATSPTTPFSASRVWLIHSTLRASSAAPHSPPSSGSSSSSQPVNQRRPVSSSAASKSADSPPSTAQHTASSPSSPPPLPHADSASSTATPHSASTSASHPSATHAVPSSQSSTDATKDRGAAEQSWRQLTGDPSQYWDNRADKTTARHPDFKHKVTGASLWLGSASAWARERVDAIPLPRSREQIWREVADSPGSFWDNRVDKLSLKGPDGGGGETWDLVPPKAHLWLAPRPVWEQQQQQHHQHQQQHHQQRRQGCGGGGACLAGAAWVGQGRLSAGVSSSACGSKRCSLQVSPVGSGASCLEAGGVAVRKASVWVPSSGAPVGAGMGEAHDRGVGVRERGGRVPPGSRVRGLCIGCDA